MITNLNNINVLMRKQEDREQQKHLIMERLESLVMRAISRGVNKGVLRKALDKTDSLKDKVVIILQNISALNNYEHDAVDINITESDIDRLIDLCEQKLSSLDLKDIESSGGSKILCLRSDRTIFDLTRKANKFLSRKYLKRTEEIDGEQFVLIYLPLYKVELLMGKSWRARTAQILVHSVNGGIFVNNHSSIDFKRVFSARQKRFCAMNDRETELKTLPDDKGDDIVVIREEITKEKVLHFISTAFNDDEVSEDDIELVYLPIYKFYIKSTKKGYLEECTERNIYLDGVFGKVVDPKYLPV
jgi:hypothetical protein